MVIEACVQSPMKLLRYLGPNMKKKEEGYVINIASIEVHLELPTFCPLVDIHHKRAACCADGMLVADSFICTTGALPISCTPSFPYFLSRY